MGKRVRVGVGVRVGKRVGVGVNLMCVSSFINGYIMSNGISNRTDTGTI